MEVIAVQNNIGPY